LGQDIITFDIAKAETSGRKIRMEADKLKRMADKLKRAVDDTPSWWVGSSRNGFTRQANELISQMYKAVHLVTELGEDMAAIAKAKKEEEARLKAELQSSLAVEFGAGATGAAPGAGGGAMPAAAMAMESGGATPATAVATGPTEIWRDMEAGNNAFSPNQGSSQVRATFESRDDVEKVEWERTEEGKSRVTITYNDGREPQVLLEGLDYYIKDDKSYFYNNVRTILEAQGVKVEWQEAPGGGSTIELSLPVKMPAGTEYMALATLVEGKDYFIGPLGKAHFLDMTYGPLPPAANKSSESHNNASKTTGSTSSVEFVLLPQKTAGAGYRTTGCNNNPTSDHQMGTPQTIANILALGELWANKYETGYVGIGDINAPDHLSHKTGVDVDIQLMKKDGSPGTRITDTINYSRDYTRELIEAIIATGDVELIRFNDQILIDEFAGRVTIIKDKVGVTTHNNHLHVRYKQ